LERGKLENLDWITKTVLKLIQETRLRRLKMDWLVQDHVVRQVSTLEVLKLRILLPEIQCFI
jgi:hypothetical protein